MLHFAIITAVVGILVQHVPAYNISTTSQTITTRPGYSIILQCLLENNDVVFDPVAHTIEWVKFQPDASGVKVTVAVGANEKGAFATGQRFNVSHTWSESRITLSLPLAIADIEVADSGLYRCQVEKDGRVTAFVEHHVSVFDPVQSLVIYGDDMNRTTGEANQATPVLDYLEGTMGYLECRAIGGYPYPSLKLYIQNKQLSGKEGVELVMEQAYLEGSTEGLKRIIKTHRLIGKSVDIPTSYDGSLLRCEAVITISDTDDVTVETSSALRVSGPPYISPDCSQNVVAVLDTQAIIRCSFSSRPTFTAVSWQGEDSQEVINGAHPTPNTLQHNAYIGSVQIVDSIQYAVLIIPSVQASHYQPYILTTTNSLGQSHMTVTLQQTQAGGVSGDGSRGTTHGNCLWLILYALLVVLIHNHQQ